MLSPTVPAIDHQYLEAAVGVSAPHTFRGPCGCLLDFLRFPCMTTFRSDHILWHKVEFGVIPCSEFNQRLFENLRYREQVPGQIHGAAM